MGTPADELSYDAFDRLVQHRRPSGALRQVGYFAFGRQVTDDDLAPVTTLMDGQGRVIRSERTIDGTVEAGEASYDPADHMVSLRLQPGTADETQHVFEYDGLGRLTFASDPDIAIRKAAK